MEYGNHRKHSAGARNVKARAKRALLLPSILSRDVPLRFGDNKSPQTSRTFLRILAEQRMALFCKSTIRVSIPMSFNLFGSSLGVVPRAPTTTGMIFTCVFHSLFISLAKS